MMVINAIKQIFAKGTKVRDPSPRDEWACEHPEDDRISTARMGHPYAFICRACGYRRDC